jgi:hypothetical protein
MFPAGPIVADAERHQGSIDKGVRQFADIAEKELKFRTIVPI